MSEASPGTALAVTEQPKVEAEKVEAPAAVAIPVALLLAAESVSARKDENRPYYTGVFVHSRGGRGRVVGTDGLRMFIASFALPDTGAPAWLKAGVILSNQQLKPRLAMIQKLAAEHEVLVSTVEGSASILLSDSASETKMSVSRVASTFPDYEKVIGAQSFSTLDEEGESSSREWQPVGINSGYLKQCGEIAKVLEAGLEKGRRTVNGMIVRAFNGGDPAAPLVFDFSSWPGAILVVAPTQLANEGTSKETAALLAPAVKASCAALTAHAKRWQQRADATENEAAKAAALRKAQEFRDRVAAIRRMVPAGGGAAIEGKKAAAEPKVEAPKPEPEAEQKPEAEAKPEADAEGQAEGEGEDEGQHQQQASDRPAVKRQRIKLNKAA